MDISLVIPIYNEAEGLPALYRANREQALATFGRHTFKRAAVSRIGL